MSFCCRCLYDSHVHRTSHQYSSYLKSMRHTRITLIWLRERRL
jgi:hypothetical protein